MKDRVSSIREQRSVREKQRSHWKEMSAWEKDNNGDYAGQMNIVDVELIFGFIPLLGVFIGVGMYMVGLKIDSWTGVGQQATRMAHITIAFQCIVCILIMSL